MGVHTCEGSAALTVKSVGSAKPRGITPTIRLATPSSSMVPPSAASSAPYRLRQRPSLMTATGGPPGRSSSSVKPRPRRGTAPSVENVFAVTAAVPTRTGSAPPPVRFASPASHAATLSRLGTMRR